MLCPGLRVKVGGTSPSAMLICSSTAANCHGSVACHVQLERVQPPKNQQQQQQQQQQDQRGKGAAAPTTTSSAPAGRMQQQGQKIKRYFMIRCVNVDNWELAQREGCWATQPQNEETFNKAFRAGHEVVLFMSINQSGTIQGYGRMTSLSGQGPKQVPWLDIDRAAVHNFCVSWDCTAPLGHDAVRHLQNPWSDYKAGARSKGPPLGLSRHRDGQELAPQIGEQLLAAMNQNAARLNRPATGPLATMGRGAPPGAAPGWQQRQGNPQMQQMQQQQRMMMMQQQQRGMGPGRGMMGPGGGMMHPGGGGPGPMGAGPPGRMMQHPQPPPPGRPHSSGAHRQPGPGPGGMRPLGNDPRLNPRFAGRLKMDMGDDMHPGSSAPRGHSPPPYGDRDADERDRERVHERRHDSRGRRHEYDYDYEQERAWERGADRHPSRGRHHSRSRSPPRAAYSSRGDSTGRAGGAGVAAESSWGLGAGSSPERHRQQDDEPESLQDMSYEQYLATWDKVQQRIKVINTDSSQTQQQQQQQLAAPPQQLAGRGGGGVPGGRGMLGGDAGGGGGVMAGGGPGVDGGGLMRQGVAAAAGGGVVDGAAGPGRPADNAIPTLAQ